MKTSLVLAVSALLALAVCNPCGMAADVATQPAAASTAPATLTPTNGDPFPATYTLPSGEVLSSLTVQTPPGGKLSPQAGTRITSLTVLPGKNKLITYGWTDKASGKTSRRVIVTPDTVINFNGKMGTFDDLTEERAKQGVSVATLNTTGVYAVMLRFEHGLLKATADDLTPKQVAALTAITPVATTQSNQSFEKKAASIAADLKLNDPAKEKTVYQAVLVQTEGVRDAHNAGFGPPKSLHADFLAALKAVLTPEQVDQVKDVLTNNMYPAAMKSITDANKDLSSDDLKVITAMFAQAREESLDLKNAEEQTPVFAKAKAQAKEYLAAHGH